MKGIPQLKYILPIAEWYAAIQVPICYQLMNVCRNSSISHQLLNGMPQFKNIIPIDEWYAAIQVYLTN